MGVAQGTEQQAVRAASAACDVAPVRATPSPETARLYAGDWADFRMWCRATGHVSLPTAPGTVAAYVATLAPRLGRGALDRRLAAIANAHRANGLTPPARDMSLRGCLRAATRQIGPDRRHLPPTATQLVRMAASCPGDLAGLRDRALLLLIAATGLGRGAALGLDAEHLRFTAARGGTGGGVELTLQLRNGDTSHLTVGLEIFSDAARGADQTGSAGLARGAREARRVCPVSALEDWLRASDTQFGPVFRKIDRWGKVEHRRLGSDAIRRILARRTPRRQRRISAAGL
jgi:hypothetical protein